MLGQRRAALIANSFADLGEHAGLLGAPARATPLGVHLRRMALDEPIGDVRMHRIPDGESDALAFDDLLGRRTDAQAFREDDATYALVNEVGDMKVLAAPVRARCRRGRLEQHHGRGVVVFPEVLDDLVVFRYFLACGLGPAAIHGIRQPPFQLDGDGAYPPYSVCHSVSPSASRT